MTREEKIRHKSQMLSYIFLSEVEKACEKRKITRKELAKIINTSPSYLTQLWRGTKKVNMDILAKFEVALGLSFTIKLK